jgi:cell division septal protein FtsQ
MTNNSWQHLPQDPQFNKQRFKRNLLCYGLWGLIAIISVGVGWYFIKTLESSVQRLEHLKFSSDGMLTEAWFHKTIPLPWKEQLLKVDLPKLQQEILRYSQVEAVEIMREFPSCIQVHIHEKKACAKILLSQKGKRKLLLITSDGKLFSPIGYPRSVLAILPTVSGLHKGLLEQQKIVQFEAITQFIKKLQTEAPDVYDRMSSLSLKHFDPSLEEKWWILELHLKGGLIATMPILKASEAFHKWKLIFKNLSQQQKTSLKKIDLSLSHPTLSF